MKPIPIDCIEGLLMGTAVGDSLGLPMEGMKPATIKKLGWSKKWRQRFFFSYGMWSDDTEHTIMLTQSLLASGGDPHIFIRKFAWELRMWLLGLPSGTGLATAKSMLKLWIGIPPHKSGVFSAGNGSAMRTAVIASFYPNDQEKRHALVTAHTRVTHSDPKATTASLAVTEIAHLLLTQKEVPNQDAIISILTSLDGDEDWKDILRKLELAWEQNLTLSQFIQEIGCNPHKGITGYAYHTVPAVIYSGVKHDWDFETVITEIISAGGDTDTTAAIAGALCGIYGGVSSIPEPWIQSICEWPTQIKHLKELALAITNKTPIRVRSHWSPILFLRNIFFLVIVLIHGFSRLLPTTLRRHIFRP